TLRDFCRETFRGLEKYGRPKPRILVEEFLHDYDPRFIVPRDFKVFVAGGRGWIIEVIDRNGPREAWNQSYYTRDWTRIEDRFQLDYPDGPTFDQPALLRELLSAAEVIARDTGVFSRLDFYLTARGAVFGEFTGFPADGRDYTAFGEKYLLDL